MQKQTSDTVVADHEWQHYRVRLGQARGVRRGTLASGPFTENLRGDVEMRPKKPKDLEEVQKRIRDAIYRLGISRRIPALQRFDMSVAYRMPKGTLYTKDLVRLEQKSLDARRRRLSRRVHRFFLQTGRISLLCNLIRRSPVFLRDKWVNDVILERRKVVCWSRSRDRRVKALADLEAIAEALLSEDLPSGELHRKTKWRRLSAKRPRPSLHTAVDLLGRYNNYLEIGHCLLVGRLLTAKERAGRSTSAPDPETWREYARRLGVPDDWIKTSWGASRMTARNWALGRLACEEGGERGGMRRRLEAAQRTRKAELAVIKRVQDARQRREQAR